MKQHSGSATDAHGDDRWVESLLVEYYESQLPAEFREEPTSVSTTAASATAVAERPAPAVRLERTPVRVFRPAERSSSSAVAAVAVAAACVLVPSLVLLSSGNDEQDRVATPDADPGDDGPAFNLATDDVFLDPAPGTLRPAEMGDGTPETVDVGTGDPEINVPSGALDIEVVPIDEEEMDEDMTDELPAPRNDATLPPEFGVEFD